VLVVALGIAESGEKHVLGVWQGATENTTVVKGLLEDLVDRGLDQQRRYLVVIDGSKALRAGVERVFGEQVEVQRCQIHKRRNVKEYLLVCFAGLGLLRIGGDHCVRNEYLWHVHSGAEPCAETAVGREDKMNS
jgi:hypothetical protein